MAQIMILTAPNEKHDSYNTEHRGMRVQLGAFSLLRINFKILNAINILLIILKPFTKKSFKDFLIHIHFLATPRGSDFEVLIVIFERGDGGGHCLHNSLEKNFKTSILFFCFFWLRKLPEYYFFSLTKKSKKT